MTELQPTGYPFDANNQAVGGSLGSAYEWLLAGYSLLTWPKAKGVVNIATNVSKMGNLDDLVFIDENKITTCVQAKHGDTGGPITLTQLLGSSNKKKGSKTPDEKSGKQTILLKFFESYEKLVKDVRYRGVERVIFFTVRDVHKHLVEHLIKYQLPVGESFPLLNFSMKRNGESPPASYNPGNRPELGRPWPGSFLTGAGNW
jgi:hypothetical protein